MLCTVLIYEFRDPKENGSCDFNVPSKEHEDVERRKERQLLEITRGLVGKDKKGSLRQKTNVCKLLLPLAILLLLLPL